MRKRKVVWATKPPQKVEVTGVVVERKEKRSPKRKCTTPRGERAAVNHVGLAKKKVFEFWRRTFKIRRAREIGRKRQRVFHNPLAKNPTKPGRGGGGAQKI